MKRYRLVLVFLFIHIFHFVVRLPSFFEPAYKDDINFYLTIGRSLFQGFVLFRDISDIHLVRPGLMYLIAGISGTHTAFQIVTFVVNSISVSMVLTILRQLQEPLVTVWGGILFVFFSSAPIFEGNEPRDELYMVCFILIALNIFVHLLDRRVAQGASWIISYMVAGFFSGLAVLVKINAVFSFISLLAAAFVIFCSGQISKRYFLLTIVALVLGFVGTICIFFLHVVLQGADLGDVLVLYKSGISYATSYGRIHVTSPYGKFILSIMGVACVFVLRKRLSMSTITFSIWNFFNLFSSLVSNKLGSHYTLQAVPSLVIGGSAAAVSKSVTGRIILVVSLIMWIVAWAIYPVKNRIPLTVQYYMNYYSYIRGHVTQEDYFRFFSYEIPRNYEVANYIKARVQQNDHIFVWGISTEIYELSSTLPSSKYIWNEHIESQNAYADTLRSLEFYKPKYIVKLNDQTTQNEYLFVEYLQQKYSLVTRVYADRTRDMRNAAEIYLRN